MTLGTSDLCRSPKVTGHIAGFDVDCMIDSRNKANLLSFEMWQKILTEFPYAKLKSAAVVRLRGFLGPEGHRVKGSQTMYLDIRG